MNLTSQNINRHVLTGTIHTTLAEGLLLPTAIITTAFLTRRLGPEDYGLFILSATLMIWIESIIASLFGQAAIKFVSTSSDWRPIGDTITWLYLITSVGVAVMLCLVAGLIANILHEPVLATYLRIFAFGLPLFGLANAHQNILIGIGAFKQRALTSAGRWLSRLVFIILLVELGFSVPGAIVGSIGALLVEFTLGRFFVRPAFSRSCIFPIKKLWGYAIPLLLCSLSLSFYCRLDLFFLKILGGTAAQAGIYGAAQNLSLVPCIFAISFSPVILSTMSRILRDGNVPLAKEMGVNAMRLVICLLPFAGMTAGAAPEIVCVIFGQAFLPAATLLTLLIFGGIAIVMISVATAILTAAGRPKWTFILTGPMVPTAVIGHLILIPRLGAIGASLVTTLLACVGAFTAVIAVYRLWKILPSIGTLLRSILVCGLAYTVATIWPLAGLLLFLKLSVIGIAIFVLFYLLGEFSSSEIALVRSVLPWQLRSNHIK